MKNKRFVQTAAILAIAGLALSILGVLGVYFTTYPEVTIRRVSFSTDGYDTPPRTVSGLLFLPEKPACPRPPAVIFSHGMTVQKEMYIPHCRQIARMGLVALGIDLRGHGATGGSNDFGKSEMRDVWAAADFLSDSGMVDPDRIGVAGHSLGGITSTRAGLFQEGDKISAVAAIYCWPSQKEAIELVFGPLDDFIGNIWPFFGMSRRYDVNDVLQAEERDIISYVNETRPPNYLLVIGEADQLGTVQQARSIMKKATGQSEIEDNRTYGDFKDGTARRLEVTSDDHLTEATGTEAFRAVVKWMFSSFGLEPPQGVSNPAKYRYFSWMVVIAGFLLVGLSSVFLIRGYYSENEPAGEIAPYRPNGRISGAILGTVSAVLFIAVSVAAFPFSNATGIRAFIPYFGVDVFASFALSRTILMVPAVLLIYGLIKLWKWNDIELKRPGQAFYEQVGFSIVMGIAPVAVFILFYAPTAHGLLLTRGFPTSAGWFFALAAVLFIQLMAEQEYFHYFFLPAFTPRDTRGKRAAYVLSEAGVRGLAFGLAFIPVVSNPFHVIGRPGVLGRALVVPALVVAGFFVFLPVSVLAFYARRRGYNVLAPCLAVALAVALFFSCFISVRAF